MRIASGIRARRWRRIFIRPLVVTLLVRASNHWAGLQIFLDQMRISALRAFLRDRLVGRSEFALRIIAAAVKRVALSRAFFDKLAVFAQRAFHANEILLHVFAIGISAARSELTVTSMSDHEIASALRAELFERNIGDF